MPENIDKLYVSLGLDIAEFEKDFVKAEKKWQTEARKLSEKTQIAKMRMEVDVSGLGVADKSIAALTTRINSLQKVIDAQNNTLSLRKKVWEESVAKYGEADNRSQRLEKSYLKERAALARLNTQMQQLNAERAGAANKPGLVDNVLGKGLGMVGITPQLFAISALSSAFIGLGKSALDASLKASQAEHKFRATLGSSALEARSWASEFSNAYNVSAAGVRDSLAKFSFMFQGLGLSKDKALEMSEALTDIGYNLAALDRADPAEVMGKIRSAMGGSAKALREYGVALDDNTLKQYAYREGIAKQGEELNRQQKALARVAAITDQLALANGALAATKNDPTRVMQNMRTEITKLEREIGDRLLPIYKEFLSTSNKLLDEFGNNNNWGKFVMLFQMLTGQTMDNKSNSAFRDWVNTFTTPSLSKLGEMNHELGITISRAERFNQLKAEINEKTGKPKYSNDKDILAQIKVEYDENAVAAQRKAMELEAKKAADALLLIEEEKNKKILDATKNLQDEIADINDTALEKELRAIQRKADEYKDIGVKKSEIDNYVSQKTAQAAKTQAETQKRIMTEVYGTELELRLLQLDQQAKAYKQAGIDEVESRRLIETQKLKIIKDYAKQAGDSMRSALMGGWGDVVNAVKDALKEGKSATQALHEAMKKNKQNLEWEREAIEMVGKEIGMTPRERQLAAPRSPYDGLYDAREKVFGPKYADALGELKTVLKIVGNTITQEKVSVKQEKPNYEQMLTVNIDARGLSVEDEYMADRVAKIFIERVEPMLKRQQNSY